MSAMDTKESSKRKKPLRHGLLLLGFALAVGLIPFALRKPELKSSIGLATQGLASGISRPGIIDASEISELSLTNDTIKQSKEQPGYNFDYYDSYLNQLCPSLTEAEEDRLLTSSGRSAKVLMGLFFADLDSARAKQWLREALLKAPNDPLVHYAVLSKAWPEFDRLHSALELAKLAPNDAAPLHAAALESLNRGDRAAAIAYLTQAAERSDFSSLSKDALDAAIASYQSVGRTESEARTRVLLQGGSQWEGVAGWDLNEQLKILGPDGTTLWGSDEVTSLLINAHQKALSAPYADLITYTGARMDEINFFAAIAADPSDRLAQYLPAPASELLANAKAGLAAVDGIAVFFCDKPGIYQRLDEQQRIELINRIYQDGEVSAYRWAYQTRPDIFRSPDFVPQGMWPGTWASMLKKGGSLLRP